MILNLIRLNKVKSTNDEAIKIIKSKKEKGVLLFLIYKLKEEAPWEKNGFH